MCTFIYRCTNISNSHIFSPFLFIFRRPTLTAKDIDDIQNWGIKHNVDFIAASFVRKQSDVEKIREVLGSAGAHIKIICKIENLEGVQNYMDILKSTDGIMVVRMLLPFIVIERMSPEV